MSTATSPQTVAVPFGKILETMAQRACQESGATPMRALVATIVAVGPSDRLTEAAEALQALGDAGTVRGILISDGDNPASAAHVAGNTVAFHGLKSAYVNNAVAALRLSSLPTLVWWRGGRPETLDGLADLADRMVLDEADPLAIWGRAIHLFEDTAFSDLRWARLTQWRALMAHFFEIPEVQVAAPAFTHLKIRGADRMSAILFANWLTSSIQFGGGFTVDIDVKAGPAVQEVRLGDGEEELVLCLVGHSCLETAVSVRGHTGVSRVVPLGNQGMTALLNEELRIRSRDIAFERAVHALVEGHGPATPRT